MFHSYQDLCASWDSALPAPPPPESLRPFGTYEGPPSYPSFPSCPQPCPHPSHQFEPDVVATLSVEDIFLRRNTPGSDSVGARMRPQGKRMELWIPPRPPLLKGSWLGPECLSPSPRRMAATPA